MRHCKCTCSLRSGFWCSPFGGTTMKRFLAVAVAAMFCFGTYSASIRAEEKVEIKKNDKEFKMKIKHKNDKEWVGEYEGRTYVLRGEPTVLEMIKDDGD